MGGLGPLPNDQRYTICVVSARLGAQLALVLQMVQLQRDSLTQRYVGEKLCQDPISSFNGVGWHLFLVPWRMDAFTGLMFRN